MTETEQPEPQQTAEKYTKRRVLESMENVIRTMGSCRKSSTRNGTPTQDHIQDLRDAIADYFAALEAHSHEQELKDVWNDAPDISQLFDEPVDVQTSTPGYDAGAKPDTVNKIATLDFHDLKQIINELHRIRSQMGIKPSFSTQHVAEIDDDLMEEVEEWRKQNVEE